MYFYSTGYGSYEDSCFMQYTHETKFSKEEYAAIVDECMILATDIELKNETLSLEEMQEDSLEFLRKCKANAEGETQQHFEEDIQDELDSPGQQYLKNLSLADIVTSDTFAAEMLKQGFKPLKFETGVCYSGWEHPFNEKHPWGKDGSTKRVVELINERIPDINKYRTKGRKWNK